ncbi:MAG TPA: branched-chain amino acid ABC transporter permease [Acetobacteraceae bacterium]|jgi:branched-chain amino acid transport system permease protein|nr:branched-chain amino acid ABC transporter permease [Acetobacteraceae bacterium]
MDAIISILFLGLAYAMILYLISVGLSVTMGLMGFVNLAHGVFAMAGGYITVTLMNRYGVSFGMALLVACVGVALLSIVLERSLYARLYGAGELEQVLFTIGLVFMAVAVVRKIWGPLPQPIAVPALLSGQINLGFRSFPTYRTFLIAVSLALTLALWLGIERTKFGARLRAAVDNRRMAESLGINTGQLFTLSFALGSGLAALGGGLGADILAIDPGYAMEYLVYFLMVVAVGGLGSIRGPFVAALLLGIGDTACKYLVPQLGAFFIYLAMIALLLWRPAGLFGRA